MYLCPYSFILCAMSANGGEFKEVVRIYTLSLPTESANDDYTLPTLDYAGQTT